MPGFKDPLRGAQNKSSRAGHGRYDRGHYELDEATDKNLTERHEDEETRQKSHYRSSREDRDSRRDYRRRDESELSTSHRRHREGPAYERSSSQGFPRSESKRHFQVPSSFSERELSRATTISGLETPQERSRPTLDIVEQKEPAKLRRNSRWDIKSLTAKEKSTADAPDIDIGRSNTYNNVDIKSMSMHSQRLHDPTPVLEDRQRICADEDVRNKLESDGGRTHRRQENKMRGRSRSISRRSGGEGYPSSRSSSVSSAYLRDHRGRRSGSISRSRRRGRERSTSSSSSRSRSPSRSRSRSKSRSRERNRHHSTSTSKRGKRDKDEDGVRKRKHRRHRDRDGDREDRSESSDRERERKKRKKRRKERDGKKGKEEEERRSILTGKKIKLKVKKDKADHERDANREDLLQFLNSAFE